MMLLRAASFLLFASFAWTDVQVLNQPTQTAHGYIQIVGIPRAEAIRKAEEQLAESRIIGGFPASITQYPFQAGLIGDIIGLDTRSVCGGSLISTTRVLTAAHCWNDGIIQVWRITVVLGSTRLFRGGTRVVSSVVAMHPKWSSLLARNDVAIIYLPNAVTVSSIITPVSLPIGSQENEDFVDEPVVAVGFGMTGDNSSLTVDQSLNRVGLNVIPNSVCSFAFPFIIQTTHICTSGFGGTSICSGDSGGPLLATRNGQQFQIGIASFASVLGCGSNLPAAFSRVTSFLDFIRSHV